MKHWKADGRYVRSDALSAGKRALIADFWTKSCPAMSGTNDFVRMRLGPKNWIQHQIHSQWTKTRLLHTDFRSETGVDVSLGPFQNEKPYFVRRGKQGTCMCGKCENLRHMQSALNNNSQVLTGAYGTKQEQALAVFGMLGRSRHIDWGGSEGRRCARFGEHSHCVVPAPEVHAVAKGWYECNRCSGGSCYGRLRLLKHLKGGTG